MEKILLDILLPAVALTWLLTEADGPWDVLARIRRWVGVESDAPGLLGKLLACGGCTALWAGVLIGLVQALPLLLSFQYPLWLAWLVRAPLAATAFVVILDMLKPYPPASLDLANLNLGDEDDDGA